MVLRIALPRFRMPAAVAPSRTALSALFRSRLSNLRLRPSDHCLHHMQNGTAVECSGIDQAITRFDRIRVELVKPTRKGRCCMPDVLNKIARRGHASCETGSLQD